MTSVSPVFGTDHTYSSTTSHSSVLVLGAPFTSPLPLSTSVPDLGATPEDENGAGLRKDKDALHVSETIREAIMAAPDIPPQSSSPPSVTGIASTYP